MGFYIAFVDVKNLVSCKACVFLLQDEVAHTVTESRVLQNTRHPFLTVRTCDRNHNSVSGKKSLIGILY